MVEILDYKLVFLGSVIFAGAVFLYFYGNNRANGSL